MLSCSTGMCIESRSIGDIGAKQEEFLMIIRIGKSNSKRNKDQKQKEDAD